MAGDLQITVALVGSISQASDGLPRPEDWSMRYADRNKAIVSAKPNDRMDDVLLSAARDLRLPSWARTFRVAFYQPEDELGGIAGSHVTSVPIVGPDGRLRWGNSLRDVTVGEVFRASEAGAIEGDPRRPYLVHWLNAGDAVPAAFVIEPIWHTVEYILALLSNVAGAAGLVYSVKKGVDKVRGISRGADDATQVIARCSSGWADRGGTPREIRAFLGNGPWNPADLAGFLDCEVGEAEALLWAFGFSSAQSGLWRIVPDQEAMFIRTVVELAIDDYVNLAQEGEAPTLLERKLRRLLDAGIAEPFEDSDLPWIRRTYRQWCLDQGS